MDKALVEGAVRIMYTRIYLPVKQKTYHSLSELNAAIWHNLEIHNNQLLQGRNYSRRMQFEEIERKELKVGVSSKVYSRCAIKLTPLSGLN